METDAIKTEITEDKNKSDEEDTFLKFLAEIIVEIIIKQTSDGCNRIRKEKHERPI